MPGNTRNNAGQEGKNWRRQGYCFGYRGTHSVSRSSMRSSLCEPNLTTERSKFQQRCVAENRYQDSLRTPATKAPSVTHSCSGQHNAPTDAFPNDFEAVQSV
jgi:hypothetical protein